MSSNERVEKTFNDIKNVKLYTEDDVDKLVNNLIDKFLNYNGSYFDNEKLKLFYQQIKVKSLYTIYEELYNRYIESNTESEKLIKSEFVDKIKTNIDFAREYGIEIKKELLSLEERYNIWFNNNYETGMERYFNSDNLPNFDDEYYLPTPIYKVTLIYENTEISI